MGFNETSEETENKTLTFNIKSNSHKHQWTFVLFLLNNKINYNFFFCFICFEYLSWVLLLFSCMINQEYYKCYTLTAHKIFTIILLMIGVIMFYVILIHIDIYHCIHQYFIL